MRLVDLVATEATPGVAVAAQQWDAPDKAQGLKMPHDTNGFINVPLAGDPNCCTDPMSECD